MTGAIKSKHSTSNELAVLRVILLGYDAYSIGRLLMIFRSLYVPTPDAGLLLDRQGEFPTRDANGGSEKRVRLAPSATTKWTGSVFGLPVPGSPPLLV